MTPGDWFVVGGLVLYLCSSASYYKQGNLPLALLYFCYAGGNVALIWAAHWRVK